MKEEWRPVKGYEDRYEVSNMGLVRSITRVTSYGRRRKSKEIYVKTINGYKVVSLFDSKIRNHKIHRLVADAFIPNPENKPCVDHIDTNRTNNNVDNLRWVTYKENANNPLSLKAQREGISKRKNLNNKLN